MDKEVKMYYIATKNEKTGGFELCGEKKEPQNYTKEGAEKVFKTKIKNKGELNVMLLKQVYPKIKVEVSIKEENEE